MSEAIFLCPMQELYGVALSTWRFCVPAYSSMINLGIVVKCFSFDLTHVIMQKYIEDLAFLKKKKGPINMRP